MVEHTYLQAYKPLSISQTEPKNSVKEASL